MFLFKRSMTATLLLVLSWGVIAGDLKIECASDDLKSCDQAAQILKDSAMKIEQFDSTPHWNSVKRLTGVAKAIVIFPEGGQAGFLFGFQWGNGILMMRDKHQWSQPVFIRFNSVMFGLLAGAQFSGGIGVILSDDALEQLVAASILVGGTADTTIGKGISGKVVGGPSGISTMMVSENRGLYFGGSIDAFQLRLDQKMNQAVYGDVFDPQQTLMQFDENHGVAANLRRRLEGIGFRAIYH
ncbi:lipid-binding SYLF domain-containing protein [Vibrio sp. ZSDZ34]|uniref:Lipid-binding SYLF domain-containing protein n=1 Tax=Vibrio gelatinilyticus TaxID=2893468 RepID=A0A9X1WAS6_9VIBR|nr:lipid-binding SYLF domain-containing protein [Vibrio gelatinilyticus]